VSVGGRVAATAERKLRAWKPRAVGLRLAGFARRAPKIVLTVTARAGRLRGRDHVTLTREEGGWAMLDRADMTLRR
jgi:hypothetical protein